jgi:Fe-S cluster assembly ATP-binding protein
MPYFEIRNLKVKVDGKEIIKEVNLKIQKGEIHALMGPNGSGKSSLAFTILGHNTYKVEKGEILFEGENIIPLTTDERAKKGIFLTFQYPIEISGIGVENFLWKISSKINNQKKSVIDFKKGLNSKIHNLKIEKSFLKRELNVGFSGGEKKRLEILQMEFLNPKIAILDEIDSGLDIDSVKLVAKAVNSMKSKELGTLIITHYQRILNYIKPDFVHIMIDGKIVKSGDASLVSVLEEKGYTGFKN